PIREGLDRARDRTVVDQRGLVGAAVLDVPIERVVARVDHAARKPAVKRGARAVEHAIPTLVPVDGFAGFGPEPFRVLGPLRVDLVLAALRGVEAGRGMHESPPRGVPDGWRQSCYAYSVRRNSGTRHAATATASEPNEPPANSSAGPFRMWRSNSATARAPVSAPSPTDVIITPYPAAPWCSTSRANTGIITR